ncbi:hypothetical protein CC2G_001447 [Coprinopsis cinerea AmutBmut pab1-1]|nr:hypothetical protein CC2G_001447 [Coprinopsis cinerea AmutBmut pab1-1]
MDSETAAIDASDPPPIPLASHIEKLPPRPAPTQAYSWRELSPNAVVIYTRDPAQADRELSKLKPGPLGFDLEWKPNYVKGGKENRVALVQLANDEMILLIQVSAMHALPYKLTEILEDPSYIKAGVGIQGDALKFFNDWMANVRSVVDLSLLARSVDNARWKGKYNHPIGLARLVEVYHYRLLEKGKIRRTNWEKILNLEEQSYAANDAHAGYTLYRHLMGMADPANPPDTRFYTFDSILGTFYEPSGLLWRPQNPDYDPGPPPPPRKIRIRDAGEERPDGEADDAQSTTNPMSEHDPPALPSPRETSIAALAHATRQRQVRAAAPEGISGDVSAFPIPSYQLHQPQVSYQASNNPRQHRFNPWTNHGGGPGSQSYSGQVLNNPPPVHRQGANSAPSHSQRPFGDGSSNRNHHGYRRPQRHGQDNNNSNSSTSHPGSNGSNGHWGRGGRRGPHNGSRGGHHRKHSQPHNATPTGGANPSSSSSHTGNTAATLNTQDARDQQPQHQHSRPRYRHRRGGHAGGPGPREPRHPAPAPTNLPVVGPPTPA